MTEFDLIKEIQKRVEAEKKKNGAVTRRYRINAVDSVLPRIITIPVYAYNADEAVAWARRYSPFKPFAPAVILQSVQVWDGQEWRWIVPR